MMLCTLLLLSSVIAQAHGSALTTTELAAGQPSFLFILVSAATRARERAIV
jgi:predicted transcriptional regulator of viral defense system